MSSRAYLIGVAGVALLAIGFIAFEFFYLQRRLASEQGSSLSFATSSQQLRELSKIEDETPVLTGPESLIRCFEKKDTAFTDRCVHTMVGGLLSIMGPRDISAYTAASTSPREITTRCHAIGHIIGEETLKRSTGLEAALSACSEECRSSCLHGALGASVLAELGEAYVLEDIPHADSETIERIGKPYCDQSAPLCHGIGHILFIMSPEDGKALASCDAISRDYSREACYQGVFMEQSGAEYALQPFKETSLRMQRPDGDYTYPCLTMPTTSRHACYTFLPVFQRALYEKNGVATTTQVQSSAKTCESLPEKERSFCFEGIGMQSRYVFEMRTIELQQFCNSLSAAADRTSCTLGALTRFLNGSTEPTAFCSAIPADESARRTLCYRAAFNWLERFRRSTDPAVLCPNDSACAAQYTEYLKVKRTLPDYRLGMWGGR